MPPHAKSDEMPVSASLRQHESGYCIPHQSGYDDRLMTITDLLILAQAAPGGEGAPQPNLLMQMFPLILIFVLFYFVLIRPQQKRQKEHEKLVAGLKSGDRVVTSAGIHGLIANVKDTTVVIKLADNIKVEFDRSAVVKVEKSGDATPAA
jgi:preprotein translocase subunit YajC